MKTARTLVAALALLAASAPACAAATWIELQERADVSAGADSISAAAADGYAVIADDRVDSALVAFDANDAVRWQRPAVLGRIERAPGGRYLVYRFGLESFAADGMLEWRAERPRERMLARITEVRASPEGIAWMRVDGIFGAPFQSVRAYGRDGSLLANVGAETLAMHAVARVLPLRGSRDAVVVGLCTLGGRLLVDVVRLDLDGREVWRSTVTANATGVLDAALHPDDSVSVAAMTTVPGGAERVVVRLERDGSVRWTRGGPPDGSVSLSVVAHGTDGLALLERDRGEGSNAFPADPLALSLIDGNGDERWRHALGAIDRCLGVDEAGQFATRCRFVAAGDRVAVAYRPSGSVAGRVAIASDDGAPPRFVDLEQPPVALEADAVRNGFIALVEEGCETPRRACRRRIAVDGTRAAPLALRIARRTPQPTFAVASGAAGVSYVVEHTNPQRLRAFAAGGAELWRVTLPAEEPAPDFKAHLTYVGTAAPTVCTAYVRALASPARYALRCHDAADGAFRGEWTTPFDRPSAIALRAIDGGELVVHGTVGCGSSRCPAAYRVTGDARSATPIRLDPAATRITDVAPNGELAVVVVADDDDRALRTFERIAPDGLRLAAAAVDDPGNVVGLHVLDGGALLLLTDDGEKPFPTVARTATLIDADGTVRWRRPIDPLARSTVVAAGAAIYVAGPTNDGRARVLRLGLAADDVGRWSRSVPATDNESVALVANAAAGELALVLAADGAIVVRTIAAADGTVVSGAELACNAVRCRMQSAELAADGRLLVGVGRGFLGGDRLSEPGAAVRLDWPRAPVQPVAASELEGAWYTPHRSGQGLLVDHVAGSNLLFAASFASDTTDRPGSASLAWLTLQGSAGDPRDLVLAQHVNRGGRFALPPAAPGATLPAPARLQFDGCDHATLLYDDAGGVHHVRALERLTRRGASCAAPAAPIEGSWFDPDATGQGLQIAAQRGATPMDDQLFAGWLTYDVDGRANDAAAQHWFTLQGPLPAGLGETVSAAIQQTISGTYDGPTASRNVLGVGTAELTQTACDRLRLRYTFDALPEARAFASRSGTLVLARLGGCD